MIIYIYILNDRPKKRRFELYYIRPPPMSLQNSTTLLLISITKFFKIIIMKKISDITVITIALALVLISCEKNQNDFLRPIDYNNMLIKSDYYYTNPNNPFDTIDNQIIESMRYLNSLLGMKNISYDDFFDSIMGYTFHHNELSTDSLSLTESNLIRDLILAQSTLSTYYFILELVSVENQVLNSTEFSNDQKERLLLFLASYRYFLFYLSQCEEWYTYYPDAPTTFDDCMKRRLGDTFSNPVLTFGFLLNPPLSFFLTVGACVYDTHFAVE